MGLWKSLLSLGQGAKTAVLGLGKTTLTVAGAGTAGYFGWEYLVNDKPLAKTAGGMLIGDQAVDKVTETIGGAVDGVSSIARSTTNAITSVGNTVANVNSVVEGATVTPENTTGMGNFLQSVLSGNGTGMIGSFINNIAKGQVSGMSFIGLIGAAIMIFGRFGWIGKVLGALLGMTILGNNINMNNVMSGGQVQSVSPQVNAPRLEVEQTMGNGMRR